MPQPHGKVDHLLRDWLTIFVLRVILQRWWLVFVLSCSTVIVCFFPMTCSRVMQTFLCEIAFNWNYWRKASFCELSRRVCFSSATPFSDWWRQAACNRRSPRRRFPSVWFYAWIPCSSVRWHWWFWEKSTHLTETPGMSGRIPKSFREIWRLKGDPAASFFQSLWKTGGPSFWRKHRRWNVFHQRLLF